MHLCCGLGRGGSPLRASVVRHALPGVVILCWSSVGFRWLDALLHRFVVGWQLTHRPRAALRPARLDHYEPHVAWGCARAFCRGFTKHSLPENPWHHADMS